MITSFKLKQLNTEEGKNIITRNLSRICDLRILDIDIINKTISLDYNNPFTLDCAKKELRRIGYSLTSHKDRPKHRFHKANNGITSLFLDTSPYQKSV
ncbi:hypothetical protein EHW67_19475 [Arenibacter aquaticus]|uniref:Heavy-metal-associated domain-containing protein n=1 Tax=Arenibacter aquaticus TaxID=2489054 RepID=A0A3S0C553_9FLAO|nr:hypothetical protein [Arenibacter aquaticus]RTE52359.1 hypothetical protein EHW67_19475 [Arenibacter aquaticus]